MENSAYVNEGLKMTTMTIVDVINILYPGQWALGNVTFGEDVTGPIFITSWNVPNQKQPDFASLEAQIPQLQAQFDLSYFTTIGTPQLAAYIDSIAHQKQYDNAVSLATYINSTAPSWIAEAKNFLLWRDAVYNYAIAQIALMPSGQRRVTTFTEFQSELPLIVWPD